jgi:hypothetical protein
METTNELLELKRKNRGLKKHLTEMVAATEIFISNIDTLMKQPSTPDRGKTIADQCNKMEMIKDCAKHFGLGIPFKDKKLNPEK